MRHILSFVLSSALGVLLYPYSLDKIPFVNFMIAGFILGIYWERYFWIAGVLLSFLVGFIYFFLIFKKIDPVNSIVIIIVSNAFSILFSGIGYKIKIGSFNI